MIATLFATEPVEDWPEKLHELARQPRPVPFAPDAVELVGAVSEQILTGDLGKRFPELAALAHWFRPASIARMRDDVHRASGGQGLRPRGCAFLIAPANVDVLFIYGWLLSLLAGNATIVRVSQKPSETRAAFLELIDNLAEEPRFRAALGASAIISYPHESSMNRTLSSWCDVRLVWGGDATVAALRAVPLKPTAVEGGFADRFSMAALDAAAILAEDNRLAEVARRFANDTLWFQQQACSSPRMVFWIGDEREVADAKARFWPLYSAAADQFGDEPAAMMSRLTDLFTMAAAGAIGAVSDRMTAVPARAAGAGHHPAVREMHSGFGTFVEYRLDRLADLAAWLTDKDQTLVVHGLRSGDVAELLGQLPNRSVDRIVKIGQATDFGVTWDGINLLDLLTRRIAVARLGN